jgi:hypothetical protein
MSQLGEVFGHVIASLERKRALMSDEVIELGFIAPDVLDGTGVVPDGTITFDRLVQSNDDTFLQFGTVGVEAVDLLESFAERHQNVEELTITDPTSDPIRFQLRIVEPPVISVLASHGGNIQHATFQDGDLRVTAHLPPTVDARRVIEAIEETYSGTTLVTRRQLTRDEE